MNLFSKFIISTSIMLLSLSAQAINVKALYSAACKRHLGVIVNVSGSSISFLSVDKGIIQVPRYEIIYMADYPMDNLPTQGQVAVKNFPIVKITTRQNHKEIPLIEGWPIGFFAEKISFLKSGGGETVIDSRNIWSVDFAEGNYSVRGKKAPKDFKFIHPYSFRGCKYNNKSSSRTIYPQQVLSDPIQIKRELDALEKGFKRVRRYEREQSFYPVPEVHKNKTELGLWLSTGSRYGSSDKRNNNFLPVFIDQYSSDIFDYQHYSASGAAPLLIGTHEEPQMQIYYTFKASYFHFSVMVDPDLVLVGENYQWQPQDFSAGQPDSRLNDITVIELGFDFGPFDLRVYGGSSINLGIWDGTNVIADTVNIPRFGLRYRSHRWWAEFNTGNASRNLENQTQSSEFSVTRANVGLNDIFDFDWTFSLINRSITSQQFNNFQSDSVTSALYMMYIWSKRIRVGGYLSNEMKDVSTNASENNDSHFKAGASAFLSF